MKYLLVLFILLSVSIVSAEITYEISWDEDDIVNGKNFKIKVIVNAEDDELYDGKLWIENDGKIISDVYDSKEDEWKSSYYYVNEYFEGLGEVQRVKLRIDEDYRDFDGDAYIHFRIRDEEEIKEEIEILKKDEGTEIHGDDKDSESIVEEQIQEVIIEPISLGTKVGNAGKGSKDPSGTIEKDINTENIVYESKGLKIIEYSVYGFAILCVLLCVLVMWRKLD